MNWKITVPILIVIVVLAVAALYIVPRGVISPNIVESKCDPNHAAYYVREHSAAGDGSITSIEFYRVATDLNATDTKIAVISGYANYAYRVDSRGRVLLYKTGDDQRSTLYTFDVCSGVVGKVLALSDKRSITDARFLRDTDTIVVVTADADAMDSARNSKIEIYESGTLLSSQLVSAQSPKYAGVGIAGYTKDVSTIFLRESGGDGGYVWGAIYRYDRGANAVRKLGAYTIEADESGDTYSGYLMGDLNSSGTRAMRVVSSVYDPADLEAPSFWPGRKCLTSASMDTYSAAGDELVVRDMATGKEHTVYFNRLDVKNICQNYLRVITTPLWLDDTHVAFSMPYGVYEIDTERGTERLIAASDMMSWNSGSLASVGLSAANDAYIFTNRASLIDRATGKELVISGMRRAPIDADASVRSEFVLPIQP